MKKTLVYFSFLALTTLLASLVLDQVYTYYSYEGAIRDRVKWIKSQDTLNHDYVILGSSRAKNVLQPELIDSLTGLSGINLGLNASGPLEIKLMLLEYLKKGTPQYLFVQTDYRTSETPDKVGSVAWMPYITEDAIYSEFKTYGKKYFFRHLLPYYRFVEFSPNIGTRNLFLTIAHKERDVMQFQGYEPIYGEMTEASKATANLDPSPNQHLLDIVEIAKKNSIKVYFFTAPIYDSDFDFSFYHGYLKNYTDFSEDIKTLKMYENVTHLNDKGATEFTHIFSQTYFPKKND